MNISKQVVIISTHSYLYQNGASYAAVTNKPEVWVA